MNARQQQILKIILEERKVKGERLAHIIQVSSRTIRNDLKEIDQYLSSTGARIVSNRNEGYQLQIGDGENFKQSVYDLIKIDDNIPTEPRDRVNFLVEKFLLSSEYLKLEDLAEEIYVSRSTIKNDIKDVKMIIDKYGLTLMQKPKYGLKISGNEKNIRFAISELLFKHPVLIEDDYDYKSWLLPGEDMELIRSAILKELKSFNFNLSDISLQNLVIHIAIASKRIKSNQYVINLNENNIEMKKEYSMARRIINNIEYRLNVAFPEVEVLYVAMHLLGTSLLLNESQSNLKSEFDLKVSNTVEILINRVEEQFNLNIAGDKELLTAIALHLKPAIHRFQHHMNLRNPMLEEIKVNYPVAFDAAILAGKVIEEEYKITVSENEIGYIALHFGTAIERAKLNSEPKRCLIVCTTGMGSSQLLSYKLQVKFGDRLNIIGTTELHNLPKYNKENVDFIVTTVPLPNTVDVPYVIVGTLFGDTELIKLEEMVGNRSSSIIDKYLKKDLIYTNLSFEKPIEVIEYLGNELIRKELTEEGIVESVLERERAASTSYGNLVAVPHPLVAKSSHTFWTIATLEKPIDWGENKVQFVCLLHVADENKEELKPMYEKLFSFINNYEIVQQIISEKNPDKIMQIVKGM
ncbi:BglG family transcription antiterminator [Salinicoccus sesuvii]|uniref:BglG family transcription antiterminator n=1 Tax=Salinicoccus sesuvii TaxID=868281 RepID=A0ABV7N7F7_9STAP